MSLISRAIIQLLANGAALYASQYFIEGFGMAQTPESYLKVAAVLTVVNLVLRPIVKFIFSPLIFLTLGLGSVVINALLLYGIDYFMPELTISGLYPLVYATLIISVINYLVTMIAKKKDS